MLVIVSDLHLTDGSTANNFNPEAFDILAERIEAAAKSRDAREVHLVLLGDIFDLERTDYWLAERIPMDQRPWGGELDPKTGMNADAARNERQFQAVLDRVITAANADPDHGFGPMLERLARLDAGLRVTYVIGNHDRVFHNFPSLQDRLKQAYPQIGAFEDALVEPDYQLAARHGHEWDENCHGFEFQKKVLKGSKPKSRFEPAAYHTMAIGEVVTAELMGGIIHHTDQLGGGAALVERLKDVNNLRPMLSVFEWLRWFGHGRSKQEQSILHDALKASLDGVLASTVAKRWDDMQRDFLIRADLVDRLQQARRFLLGDGFAAFEGRVRRLTPLLSLFGGGDALRKGAAKEYADGTVADGTQFVVYGHTHDARHDYFRAEVHGRVQMYVNTGTFLPLISRADDKRSFADELQMTMVFVYREDEDRDRKRGGPSIDIWKGTRRKTYQ